MTRLEVRNDQGERLDCAFHSGAPGRRDVLVLGHGVTANKDRPFLVALAQATSAAGIATLRVSFSGNGASEGRFEDSCISKEVRDLGAVLDALDGHRVAYAGHSMGGAVGVLRAASDERVRLLVSLAGMVHVRRFAERKFGALVPGRDTMWDKPECPLSQAFLDDMERIDSVAELGARIRVPWLLVHGTGDEVVPLADSLDVLACAPQGADARLVRLEGADHVFSGGATGALVVAAVPWLVERFSTLA